MLSPVHALDLAVGHALVSLVEELVPERAVANADDKFLWTCTEPALELCHTGLKVERGQEKLRLLWDLVE